MIELKDKNVLLVLQEAGYKPHPKKGYFAGGFIKRERGGQWHGYLTNVIAHSRVQIHYDMIDGGGYHRVAITNRELPHLAWLKRIAGKIKKDEREI
jgi:hypothetical protein